MSPNLIWKAAEKAVIAGDVSILQCLLRANQSLFREQHPPAGSGGLRPDYSRGDAKAIILWNHHFDRWPDFVKHLNGRKQKNSPVAQFEAAVDAIVAGKTATLKRLLRQNPELIRARSLRNHRSTPLHYVGANGVEYYRQRTPKNAVKVAKALLDAGAEIDALADMYGGSTTLGLIATSIHPYLAGLQNALIDLFLKHGAQIDHPTAAGNKQSIVNGCLANGRPHAAEFLAKRGAPLDIEGAAGVGHLDVVKTFFNKDGTLKPNATEAQLRSGFNWACEYGRTRVVEFLLQTKFDFNQIHRGETGLHWAAYGGHTDIVKLLLKREAGVEIKDQRFGGTALGWALYAWGESAPGHKRNHYYKIVSLLVTAGAHVDPAWLNESDRGFPLDQKIRNDPRMRAALKGSKS
jgi:ankyrin repeat protein